MRINAFFIRRHKNCGGQRSNFDAHLDFQLSIPTSYKRASKVPSATRNTLHECSVLNEEDYSATSSANFVSMVEQAEESLRTIQAYENREKKQNSTQEYSSSYHKKLANQRKQCSTI